MPFKTGARPSPRHALCAAPSHRIAGPTPAQFLWLPSKLDIWGNDVHGDCVTAEEAFNKACSGIYISPQEVLTWATANGVLEGADLSSVMSAFQKGGFSQDGNTYDDGTPSSVDWTSAPTLQNAIAMGPVKIACAAADLQNVPGIGGRNGWVATGFRQDGNIDHCTSLCGYGPMGWLAQQLGGTLPAGVNAASPGYGLFTWGGVGVIDVPSMLNITAEAWLRTPNTVTVGTGTPTPDPLISPPPGPTPTPTPTPTPVPTPTPTPGPTPLFTLMNNKDERAKQQVKFRLPVDWPKGLYGVFAMAGLGIGECHVVNAENLDECVRMMLAQAGYQIR